MKDNNQLYEDIREKLDFEPSIDPRNLTYSVDNGVVTINGSLSSYIEKQAVKRAVYSVLGVKGIADETIIEHRSASQPNDKDIVTAVTRVLDWEGTLGGSDIKVTVENGIVTLSGKAPWFYQKENAERVIRYLDGIVCINNQIQVDPRLAIETPDQVKEKIKKELVRHALLDAKSICVEILGTRITLQGHVESWAEYKEASHIAWSIPGVSHVDNQILIKN